MARSAKCSRPRLAGVLPRERLFARLDACRDGAATWIWGPPGTGKTTLAASWLDARQLPALWYQMDRGDADPAAFFAELGGAVRQPGLCGGGRLPLFTPECLTDLEGFARRWFAALFDRLPRPCAVVFDNAHEAGAGGAFDAVLRALVEQVPPGIHVLSVSRMEPPPGLARARVSNTLAVVGWPELRFSADEAGALGTAGTRTASELRQLVERCDGWAAGLILLLEHAQSAGGVTAALQPQRVLFDYFATELFDRLPAPTQYLLLRTALLPWISEPMARALAGSDDAPALLEGLHRSHLFVEHRAGCEPSWQVHALLREFLLDRMRQTLAEGERRDLERLSADQLALAGEHAAAMRLYLQAGAAEPALRLVLAQAPTLLEQGRVQTLAQWAQAVQSLLPQPMPWLGYWLGACEFLTRPAQARARWEQAFTGFEAGGDAVGAAMAAAGIIDSHIIEYRRFAPIDPWTARLIRLFDGKPAFPHPQLELVVLTSLCAALVMRTPQQCLSRPYAARARELLPLAPSVNVRVMCAARLLHHDIFVGQHAQSAQLIDETRGLLADPALPPLTMCHWLNFQSLHFQICDYDEKQAAEAMQSLLETAQRHGLHTMAVLCRARMAMLLLESGDLAGARRQLALGHPAADDASFDAEWSRAIGGWIAMLDGDTPTAVQTARRLVAANAALGITSAYGMALVFQANALLAGGDLAGARASIDECRAPHVPLAPTGEFTCLLLDADIALRLGDGEAAGQALRRAFAMAREQRLLNTLQWLPAQMTRLCAFALERGVERSFVLELIRVRRLPPPEAGAEAAQAWPWPLRIHCLGRFEIVKDGEPLRFEGKVQRRPLALLKVLVALGGERVPIDTLIEAVWGEALDGDEQKAFDVTLHRLRKLLGSDRAIRVGDHRVSLDAGLAWVDLRALDQTLQRALSCGGPFGPDPATLEQAAPEVLRLCAGLLLADEPSTRWLAAARQRLRSRVERFVAALGAHRERSRRWHDAASLYERCLELGYGTETFTQRMLVCQRERDAAQTRP